MASEPIFKLFSSISMDYISVFETAVAAECRDTEARPFQILSRFTQPHCLCSWSQSEIYQNLDSNSAATLGPRAQVNYTIDRRSEKTEQSSRYYTQLTLSIESTLSRVLLFVRLSVFLA